MGDLNTKRVSARFLLFPVRFGHFLGEGCRENTGRGHEGEGEKVLSTETTLDFYSKLGMFSFHLPGNPNSSRELHLSE